MSKSAISSKLTKEYFQYIFDELQKNPRAAHGLINEVIPLFPEAKERQMYKLLYPFVHFQCVKQLNYAVSAHIIEPMFAENYEKLRSPNNYSMLIMNYGYQFVLDTKSNRDVDADSGEKPFRYSLFYKFQMDVKKKHQDLIQNDNGSPLLIYLLHLYLLNGSLDKETLSVMVAKFQENLNEDALRALKTANLKNLAKSLKAIVGHTRINDIPGVIEYEQLVSKIFLERYAEEVKNQSLNTGDENHEVSKENIYVRDCLKEMGVEFQEEQFLKDALVTSDFYIPSAKLAIEINGRNHFYPYSTKYGNFTNLKFRLLRQNGHNMLNLNSWKLEGLMSNNNVGLKDLLGKTINTYSSPKETQE